MAKNDSGQKKGKKEAKKRKEAKVRKFKSKERAIKEKKSQEELSKIRDNVFSKQDTLEARLLCAAIEVDSVQNVQAAAYFLHYADIIRHADRDVGRYIDEVITLSSGKVPRRYEKLQNTSLVFHKIAKDMRSELDAFELHARKLESMTIGKVVAHTENLAKKIYDAAEKEHAAVFEAASAMDKLYEFMLPGDDKSNPKEQAQDLVEFFVDHIRKTLEIIERHHIGIPFDFFNEVCSIFESVKYDAAAYFIKKVTQKIKESKTYQESSAVFDQMKIGQVISFEPENVLPDPEYVERLKNIAARLDALEKPACAISTFEKLLDFSVSENEALRALEKVQGHEALAEAIEHVKDRAPYLVKLFGEDVSFSYAYKLLKNAATPQKAAQFLLDYGDFNISGQSVASHISKLKNRPDAIRLVAEHGLAICVSENPAELFDIVCDTQKGTRIMRAYTQLAEREEVYKQFALLTFAQRNGTSGLSEFVEKINEYTDDEIGAIIGAQEDMLAAIKNGVRLQENKYAQLKNKELVGKYHLMNDIQGIEFSVVDDVLAKVAKTAYESVLLGQQKMRKKFFDALREDKANSSLLDGLEKKENPYAELASRLFVKEKETIQTTKYTRIFVVSNNIPRETASYLQLKTGVEVRLIGDESPSGWFDGLRETDLVVKDWSSITHELDYRIKAMTKKRGNGAIYAPHKNKEELLKLVAAFI